MNFLKKNKIILGIFLILVGAYAIYQYIYQEHKTTEELKAEYIGNAQDFLANASKNFEQWNNKTIELSGTITSKDKNGIMLNQQIYCQFREDIDFSMLKVNQKIQLKGRLIGYDNLLEEFKLNHCILK